MSAKLKNAGFIKGFFLSHGEKLGVAVVAGLAGWLVYSSLGVEPEERVPKNLTDLISRAASKVDGFSWDEALTDADPAPHLHTEFVAAASEQVKPEDFEINRRGWNRDVVPPVVLRRDPVLLPPTDLEGNGFTVLMPFYSSQRQKQFIRDQMAQEERRAREQELAQRKAQEDDGRRRGRQDEPYGGVDQDPNKRQVTSNRRRGSEVSLSGGELVKIQSCAVVVGKVPVDDQLKIYTDVFENALGYDAGRDVPQYLGYFVQRAEVRGDEPLKFENLKIRSGLGNGKDLPAVTGSTIPAAIADWIQEAEPLLDPNYFHPVLTFPLPALINHDWGPEVVHSDLPLAAETEAEMARMEDEEEDVLDPTAEGEDSIFGNDLGSGRGMMGEGMGRRPGMGRGMGRGMMSEGGMGMRRGMGRGMGMGEEGMGGGMRSRGGGMSGEYGFAAPHAMIRHVDFFARPGRSYVYRFQLVLLDVNGKGQTRTVYLEKDVKKRVDATRLTATPIIRTEWSEPTRPVSIPLAGNVIIGEAQRPAAGEPTVTMVVESFDIGDDGKAMQGSIEKAKVRIGTVMNAVEKDVWILSSEERAILEKIERFRFRTGMTVLDIDGGEKLSKQLVAPANVLMMDATGRLSVRSELKDMTAYEDYRDIFEEDEDDADSFRGGGEFMGGGEFEMGF